MTSPKFFRPATRVLLVGCGAIGLRHADILRSLGHGVGWVTRRNDAPDISWGDLNKALTEWLPSHILITNETKEHIPTLKKLVYLGFRGPVLVEKPLAVTPEEISDDFSSLDISVAYNLRFLETLKELRTRLLGERAMHADITCSSYLPGWTPCRDYRRTYRQSRDLGGGVLRDVSHELDLALHLFGRPRRLVAVTTNHGLLGIDADEYTSMIVETTTGTTITLRLDLYSRTPRRSIITTTGSHTFELDLLGGLLSCDGERLLFGDSISATYERQLVAWLSRQDSGLCSYIEGRAVIDVISAAERSMREQRWISMD